MPATARAQEPLGPPPRLATRSFDPVLRPSLTREELDGFAAAAGESPAIVARVLAIHPDFVAVAADAASHRSARQRSAAGLVGAGFSILGAGLTVGLLAPTTGHFMCMDGQCQQQKRDATAWGTGVAVVSLAIGLALVIPGYIKGARESRAETSAIERYRALRAADAW